MLQHQTTETIMQNKERHKRTHVWLRLYKDPLIGKCIENQGKIEITVWWEREIGSYYLMDIMFLFGMMKKF